MENTANLSLPYIMPSQAQKHVTHNEALRMLDALVHLSVLDRDTGSPPSTPAEGDRYIVAPSADGAWSGQEGRLAAWQDGAWSFYEPATGVLAWVSDEERLCVFDGAEWVAAGVPGAGLPLIGVNTTADETNRLAVASPATLFNHDGAGHQLKINKAASEDTASILFQSSFSGRAEMGLAGDESFAIKTSSNGDDWIEVCKFDADGRDLRGYGQNVQTGGVSPRVQYNATDTGGSSFAMTRWSNDGNGPGIYLRKSRGGLGSFTAVQSGDTLGTLSFGGSNNSSFTASMDANVRGEAETDFASSINTRLRFLTRSSGASVERMRLSGQAGVHFPTVGTTGNAANAFLDNAATPSNQLLRSTSSLAYKYDVERLDDEVAATFLSEAMPIWYRSMAVADKLDDGSPKSFYSFGAEHLAAIDPRLVTWGYRPEDWEISATEDAEGSETAERVLKRDARKVPDGINDRAVVAILVSVVQRLDERVRALEAQGRSAGPA